MWIQGKGLSWALLKNARPYSEKCTKIDRKQGSCQKKSAHEAKQRKSQKKKATSSDSVSYTRERTYYTKKAIIVYMVHEW